ncbi:LysM peptidoglycan-binding domain-containing protein [Treponema pedis]|uniref:LysM peptidoglycan-binding domain-containing protein n=1 Tax=Treponema pedis TaxID=409322 RepID=UPI0004254D59|nr:LysM peptidoglycan-binding domain-containing protein [Treponema pedis]
MTSKIGIKLADGTFFPILDENASSEHVIELTTVRENQGSVQINLFKKSEESEPEYIGSLIVEEISDGAAGEPTISLKIKLDEEKNLSAEAVDEGSGSKQSLKVSLKTLNEDTFDVPDFDLSSMGGSVGEDLNGEDIIIPESETDYSVFEETEKTEEIKEKKKFPLWVIILLIILCIGALVFAILLLTKKIPFMDKNKLASSNTVAESTETVKKTDMNSTTSVPPKEDTSEKVAAEAKRKAEEEAAAAEAKRKAEEEEAAMEAKRKAEESAAAEAKRQAEKEAQEAAKKQKTPKVNADGSVRYKIKWGDTLWDLSESFYKTPWLYKKIANHNKIKNPNLIISGTYIDIPPK